MPRSIRRLFGSLCLLQAATGINWSIYFAFAGFFFRDKFGLSLAATSVLVSSAFLTYCLVQFAVSLLLDVGVRLVGERWMLLRSPIIYGVGMVLLTIGTIPATVVLAGGLIGFGAATSPLILAALADRTPKRRSGLVVSLLGAAYIVGQLAALLFGWILVSHGGAATTFASLCAMWLIVSVVLLVTLDIEPLPGKATAPFTRTIVRTLTASLGDMRLLLSDPRTRALKAVIFLAGVAPVLAGIYIPLYFIGIVNDPGLSAAYIAASTAIGYILGGLLTPALGAYSDRQQNQNQLLLLILIILTIVVLLVGQFHDPIVVSALTVTLTVGSQWVNTLQSAILMVEVGRDAPTTFFAVNQLPFYGGLPVGLVLSIGAVGLTGSVANALLVVAAMFGLGALIWGRHSLYPPRSLSPTRGERGTT